MARKVSLNHAGVAAILKSTEMHQLVQDAAEKVAKHVGEQGITVGALSGNSEIALPVEVSVTTTDRAHARVTLAHPAGVAVQAKHGSLTRAASAEGLTVRGG